VKKEDAELDEWNRDAAPSTELRRWYGHAPDRFDEFARRYGDELGRPPASEAVAHLLRIGREQQVVLLTATRDLDHSGARVLHDHLTTHQR